MEDTTNPSDEQNKSGQSAAGQSGAQAGQKDLSGIMEENVAIIGIGQTQF